MIYCPQHITESLERYARDGIETGGFLRAVLENDLYAAVRSADETNLPLIPAIVRLVLDSMPAAIIGSPESVARHLKAKRMEMRAKMTAAAMGPES